MKNVTISNAKNVTDIIMAMSQTGVTKQYKNTIKPQERERQRQKENKYLIHEIVNSLMA